MNDHGINQANSLDRVRGVQTFLESTLRTNSRDIDDWVDDVELAARTLQGALDAALTAQAEPVADELGWLIEMRPSENLLWWDGGFDVSDDYPSKRLFARMVNDVNKAVRLSRREDAQCVLDAMLAVRPSPLFARASTLYSVQEHMWPFAAQPHQAEPMAWRPMRTAPKDGTAVLVLADGSDIPRAVRWLIGPDDKFATEMTAGPGWHLTWDGTPVPEHDGPRYWMHCPDDPDEPAAQRPRPAEGE